MTPREWLALQLPPSISQSSARWPSAFPACLCRLVPPPPLPRATRARRPTSPAQPASMRPQSRVTYNLLRVDRPQSRVTHNLRRVDRPQPRVSVRNSAPPIRVCESSVRNGERQSAPTADSSAMRRHRSAPPLQRSATDAKRPPLAAIRPQLVVAPPQLRTSHPPPPPRIRARHQIVRLSTSA